VDLESRCGEQEGEGMKIQIRTPAKVIPTKKLEAMVRAMVVERDYIKKQQERDNGYLSEARFHCLNVLNRYLEKVGL